MRRKLPAGFAGAQVMRSNTAAQAAPREDEMDYGKTLDELRRMKWEPKYHGQVRNDSAPGGVVDMWLLVDAETGDGILSLGVPKGRDDIVGYIAACCSNPVRWVTAMDQRDLRQDGVHDPAGALHEEANRIADALFDAYQVALDGQQANGWTLNDALSYVWFAFCGQLSHELRGRLLFRFLQMATTDYKPPPPVGNPGSAP
jgi:hypothetical protein